MAERIYGPALSGRRRGARRFARGISGGIAGAGGKALMQTFRVWAPKPKKVELQLGAKRLSMQQVEGGWWLLEVSFAEAGAEYGFVLDDEGPFPDPRSAWQPQGIDGPSRTVDHAAFRWTDTNWHAPPLSSAIIYELHIGTFTPAGTFDAVIDKLDYLKNLGITHVELMPVNEFSGSHGWGYDGVDLYAPHHAYGAPEGLKRLVDACHGRGLAVILDVVYNHLGPAGNYLGKFGPYFTRKYASPWGEGINFDDGDNTEVRRFFCDNALMWLRDYHFDGLRLDAVHAIVDTSAIPFLEQLSAEVKSLETQLQRNLVLIPESDLNDPRLLWSAERGGFALDAQWSDDFHHALHTVLTGEKKGYYADFGSLEDLCKALRNAFVYDGKYSHFRRRVHGRPPEGLNGHRFLGYLQNHDQVGNRARGERSAQLMSTGRLKIAAALVMMSPFIPMLFQGEEWGAGTPFLYFTNHQDPKLGEAVRNGRRGEFAAFGWNPEEIPDPQAQETFQRSKLNWSEPAHPVHTDLVEWHRRLIQLRKSEPCLSDGALERITTRADEAQGWFFISRGSVVVCCNIGRQTARIPLPCGEMRVVLASALIEKSEDGEALLPPDSVAVIKQG
jgi:maltooligosyltrehalose trehalohydrolase